MQQPDGTPAMIASMIVGVLGLITIWLIAHNRRK